MSTTTVVSQLLSVRQAATHLACSPDHVYDLIRVGKLRSVETKATGKRTKTRVRAEDLQGFIDANTRTA